MTVISMQNLLLFSPSAFLLTYLILEAESRCLQLHTRPEQVAAKTAIKYMIVSTFRTDTSEWS